jgi:hypothetical protein
MRDGLFLSKKTVYKKPSNFFNALQRRSEMPFNVGDVVRVKNANELRPGLARIQQVLPRTLSIQDFQEYVVEFMNFRSERFRFGLCRECELGTHSGEDKEN